MKKVLGGTGAAIAAKLVTGFAVAAFAAAGATEAAITGSLNPNDWGQQVVQQVNTCKAALQQGQHGIGQCVSAFASQHGAIVSAEHRASGARHGHASDARTNDNGKGNHGKGNQGKGKGNGGGSGDTGGGGQSSDNRNHGKPSPQPEQGS